MAAVAMAAVTADVTTGGVVSEVGVTAAETEDSEEVVTEMVDAEGECLKTHFYQFWSLTVLYSVDYSQSRICLKSAFSTNAQSRFASFVVDGVLGPPRLGRHT